MRKKLIKQEVTVVHEKFRRCLPPYEDYHSAGPYPRECGASTRWYINIFKNAKDGEFGILYARYLLEVTLGRRLRDGYEVDHIDGCKWNDNINNLQEIPSNDNRKKGQHHILDEIRHARVWVQVKCPECGNWFERKRSMMHGTLTFCSRHCNGKFWRTHSCDENLKCETRDIPMPDISCLPPEFHEPFEEYSTELVQETLTRICHRCGKPMPSSCNINCPACVKAINAERHDNDLARCRIVAAEILKMFREEGKVAIMRIAPRVGISDKGIGKLLQRVYNKPVKDVIKDICTGKILP